MSTTIQNQYINNGVNVEVLLGAREALVAQSHKRSAVFDALTNPTSVHVEVA